LASNASPSSAIGSLLAGGQPGDGADAVQAQLQALAGQIRDVGQMVDAIATDFPAAAQEASQVKQILKSIIVKVAQQSSPATASGTAVPTGATMGPQG
jgi:outer membrane murein-binding lipoprotein Lpp